MLATDLLLLALDDERGTVLPDARIGLDYGLAGALVMELALCGRLRLDGTQVFAIGADTGDALLDDASRAVAAAPGKELSYWIPQLVRGIGNLRQRLLERLVAQGTLEKREQRILLLFHRETYPERDGRVEHDLRAQVDAVLLHGQSPDARTTCLIQLAAACRVTDALYPKSQHATLKKRIAELDDAGKAGADAVASAVTQAEAAAVNAAMVAAITASTLAATSAATSAACSAASAAACR